MPYTVAGVYKISDHRVMSPVQGALKYVGLIDSPADNMMEGARGI
jgi:hypothetical protein